MSESAEQIYKDIYGNEKKTKEEIEIEKQELPFADLTSYEESD
jgi:hypothetical protein